MTIIHILFQASRFMYGCNKKKIFISCSQRNVRNKNEFLLSSIQWKYVIKPSIKMNDTRQIKVNGEIVIVRAPTAYWYISLGIQSVNIYGFCAIFIIVCCLISKWNQIKSSSIHFIVRWFDFCNSRWMTVWVLVSVSVPRTALCTHSNLCTYKLLKLNKLIVFHNRTEKKTSDRHFGLSESSWKSQTMFDCKIAASILIDCSKKSYFTSYSCDCYVFGSFFGLFMRFSCCCFYIWQVNP